MPATEFALPVGFVLANRYQIVRELGIGGMGRVYLAEDLKLETQVAIKVLREMLSRDSGSVKRLIAEAKHSIRLSHPNIVRVNHFEDGEMVKFLVMEYVEGQTLADCISEKEKLPEDEARRIGIEICRGLEHAHELKVIHRDIKPGNILIRKDRAIKIADFGIARECRDSISRLTSQVDSGTLLYMSPEQLLGKSSEASDIYSLGIVLYEMLTGDPPFRSGDVTYQIRKMAPDPLVGVSPSISAIVMKCLGKKPEERFASASKLREELEGTAERRRQEDLRRAEQERLRAEEEKKREEQEAARRREEEERRKLEEATRRNQEDLRRKADMLVAEASTLLEHNRHAEAELRFQEALKLCPAHATAKEGMNRCRDARSRAAQACAGTQAEPTPVFRTTPAQHRNRNMKTAVAAVILIFVGWFVISRINQGSGTGKPEQPSQSGPPNQGSQPPRNQAQVRKLLDSARQAQAAHDYDAAIMAYSNVLVLDPSNQEAISGKAVTQKVKDEKAAAAKALPGKQPSLADLVLTAELSRWAAVKDSDDPAAFRDYINKFPSGQFVSVAKARIRSLDIAQLKTVIQDQISAHNWDAAGQKINELTRIAPDDPEVSVWRKQVSGEIEAERKAAGRSASVKTIAMEFLTIPAGKFIMGCSVGDSQCDRDENPRHEVTITKGFELGKYEVTQGQWMRVMGNNPSRFNGDDRLPVEQVSWNDVQAFIAKLNSANDGYRYRLPTEAEWEYAARGGTAELYYGNLDAIAWYVSNSGRKTHPVGQKQPNGFGLYDMLGNVRELCADWYGENYYVNSPSADPKGPSTGAHIVLRNGSWRQSSFFARVSDRATYVPGTRDDDFGFRVCREKL